MNSKAASKYRCSYFSKVILYDLSLSDDLYIPGNPPDAETKPKSLCMHKGKYACAVLWS